MWLRRMHLGKFRKYYIGVISVSIGTPGWVRRKRHTSLRRYGLYLFLENVCLDCHKEKADFGIFWAFSACKVKLMKSVAGWIITGKLNKENFGSSERKGVTVTGWKSI